MWEQNMAVLYEVEQKRASIQYQTQKLDHVNAALNSFAKKCLNAVFHSLLRMELHARAKHGCFICSRTETCFHTISNTKIGLRQCLLIARLCYFWVRYFRLGKDNGLLEGEKEKLADRFAILISVVAWLFFGQVNFTTNEVIGKFKVLMTIMMLLYLSPTIEYGNKNLPPQMKQCITVYK